jgi:hypothetical protein
MMLEFKNAPTIDPEIKILVEQKYFGGTTLTSGAYRDALLRETLDFHELRDEIESPVHGHSKFHIGHQDPSLVPKHVPDNIFWRTHRSNLIQGNMTLREARIYIIKLIARYFEIGELEIK